MPELVEALNAGESHIEDVPSEALAAHVDDRAASPRRSTTSELKQAARDPDRAPDAADEAARARPLATSRRAAHAIGAVLQPGQLVVLESTTYPGHDPRRRQADPRSRRAG